MGGLAWLAVGVAGLVWLFKRTAPTGEEAGRLRQAERFASPFLGVFVEPDRPASDLDWDSEVEFFSPAEFVRAVQPGGTPIDTTPYVAAETVLAADELRRRHGRRLIVSPAPGAVARVYGSTGSEHWIGYLGSGRLSHALDLMVPDGDLMAVGSAAEAVDALHNGGFGPYPDWSPYPGVHIDTRGERARWMAIDAADGGQEYLALDWGRVQTRLRSRRFA